MEAQPDQNTRADDDRPAAEMAPEIPSRKSGNPYFAPLPTLAAIIAGVTLAALALPFFETTTHEHGQFRELAYAKQIGLALKLYAGDHDGVYPAGTNTYGQTILTSNDAFRSLFPTYTQSETLFGNKRSAWQTSVPDNIIDPAPKPDANDQPQTPP